MRALRLRRRMLELSQREVAARANIGEKHLGEIERGQRDPHLSTVIRLLDALDLSSAEIAEPSLPRLGSASSTATARRRVVLANSNERRGR